MAGTASTMRLLFFGVVRITLMPDRQDQQDVLGRPTALLRDTSSESLRST